MSVPSSERHVVEAERRVLRALCQEKLQDFRLTTLKKSLTGYRWHAPAHLVIFECLIRFPRGRGLLLRDYLAGCATRKGFPDLDWEDFFDPVSYSASQVESLMKELGVSE